MKEVDSREEFNNKFYDQSYSHEDQCISLSYFKNKNEKIQILLKQYQIELNKSFDRNHNKVIFVKHVDERNKQNKVSSNAKELDSILNKYKSSPKQVDSSFRSFYEKSNRSSGSVNSNKQSSQKTIDSKKGYISSKNNNQLNTSSPNLKQNSKQYQNYVGEAKSNKVNNESKYEQQQLHSQNKIFKQLQYADQKNVFHRLSRQSPLKYDSNIKPTQQFQLKKQNSSNSKLGKEDSDYKQQIFKENYTQNLNNQSKQNMQTSYSPPHKSNQVPIIHKQQKQFESSKSPKLNNEISLSIKSWLNWFQ